MPERSLTRLVGIARKLAEASASLSYFCFSYHPLQYAWEAHRRYLELIGPTTGRVLLLGMNPGPFGMVQTGIPFGDVSMVRDWLGIDTGVRRPREEHEKRPVLGFACERSEVSGSRLWGWARNRYHTPEGFFSRFVVVNYCPVAFLEPSGRNLTPDKLPADERKPLLEVCDEHLRSLIDTLDPSYLVGIGKFAEKRLRKAGGDRWPVGSILHPSPASPLANKGWQEQAEAQLAKLQIAT